MNTVLATFTLLGSDGILNTVLANSGDPEGLSGGNLAVLLGQQGGGFVLGNVIAGIQNL